MREPRQPLSNHPIHPWYGPCDALANGVCAECIKVVERLWEALLDIAEDDCGCCDTARTAKQALRGEEGAQ